ncbi:MAG: 30S ribosomal protein S4 [Thermogutta sp.]|uniref:30S ribosomal protein S4 n=1 Tax=Thermogutta sp. TaxID=1962930 RepID=UPI0019A9B136|nr:30S ribosomal protein S4 [Thermogutta sp.]MBC7352111.1 30S ribosomal protein S4 [Thermogutta sp.]
MARYTGPVCRLCRREGMKLFLKGTRCDTDKCAFERHKATPGMQGVLRSKPTDYALHLREKQKLKRYYGILERQFRRYFQMATRSPTNTGEVLLSLLERRLDNIVYRLGFGLSRAQARQIVRHGHILVNGRTVDIPSYLVSPGDVITVKNRPRSLELVKRNLEERQPNVPDFLNLVPGQVPEGHVLRNPTLEDVSIPVQPQLVIEFCSR